MKLAENLELKAQDYANQGNSMIGIRGSGKTYAGTKAAEELMAHGIPIVAIDPTGVWQNLRYGIDGHAGFQVIIVGGGAGSDYVFIPGEETETARAAMLVAMDMGSSIIFDLKGIATSNKAQWMRIVVAVVETLLEHNSQYGLRHIFIEEAAEFVPQRPSPGGAVAYSRIESLARMGRNFGLGYTLLNQRAEEVAKAIFEISEQVLVFRQAGKNSLSSIKSWLDLRGLQDREIIRTLPNLENGECWAISDTKEVRCKILPKTTVHPDPKRTAIATFTNVHTLQERIVETFLERMTQSGPKEKPAKSAEKVDKRTKELENHIQLIEKENEKYLEELRILRAIVAAIENAVALRHSESLIENVRVVKRDPPFVGPPALDSYESDAMTAARSITSLVERKVKDNAPQRMLKACAMFPNGITKSRMCLIAGTTTGSSTCRGALAWMRKNNYITDSLDNGLIITAKGLKEAGEVGKPGNLVEFWKPLLPVSSRRALISLHKVHPHPLTKTQLAGMIGTNLASSTLRAVLATLRKNKLVQEDKKGILLSDELVNN